MSSNAQRPFEAATGGETPAGTDDLLQYLSQSPTAFHAVRNAARVLEEHGFVQLHETEQWALSAGAKHYVIRNGGALVAFRVGKQTEADAGFRIAAAHTDSPALKLKLRGAKSAQGGFRVPVEVYGGPIVSTWLDRDLSIAGRVLVRRHGEIESRLLAARRPVAIIPNVAIHLNRDVNSGFEYNKHEHLPALLNLTGPDQPPNGGNSATESAREAPGAATDVFPNDAVPLVEYVAHELGEEPSTLLAADLLLWNPVPAQAMGGGGNLFTSGRIDNLAGAWSVLRAIVESQGSAATQVAVLFDNEEVGSLTGAGANSSFLESLLQRIVSARDSAPDAVARATPRSFLVSNDAAHALHPNFPGKYDEHYAPVLGEGPALKLNAALRYATTDTAAAQIIDTAQRAGVPLQYLANRADMRTGSTVGPYVWSRTGIATVDVGVPILAMHSIRETASLDDAGATRDLMRAVFVS